MRQVIGGVSRSKHAEQRVEVCLLDWKSIRMLKRRAGEGEGADGGG